MFTWFTEAETHSLSHSLTQSHTRTHTSTEHDKHLIVQINQSKHDNRSGLSGNGEIFQRRAKLRRKLKIYSHTAVIQDLCIFISHFPYRKHILI